MLSHMVLRSFFYLGMPNFVRRHGGVTPKLCVCSHLLLEVFTEVGSVFSWLLVLLLLCQRWQSQNMDETFSSGL